MKSPGHIATLVLGITVGCGQGSSGQSTTVLDRPEATLPDPFTQVGNIVEMNDGRIAFTELRERKFLFGDFRTGKVDGIGEHAETIQAHSPAPGRHKFPGHAIKFPGDTLGLVDFAAERTTLWNGKGDFLAVVSLGEVAGGNQPLVYDSLGYAYKEDFRSVMGGLEPGQRLQLDSLNVLRFPREGTIADTVAKLKLPEFGEGHFGEQTKSVATIFAGRDVFGALPDGSLWVARAGTYRVDWRSPDGKWQQGQDMPYAKVPVTQVDKDRFMETMRKQMAQSGAPAGIALTFPFAEFKPPFAAAVTRPEGEVWLLRSRPASDSVPVYDVVGRDGRRTRVVQLPKGASVAGFGRDGAVYAVLKEGDHQTIARFRLR